MKRPDPADRPIPVARLVVPPEPRWLVLLMLFVLMGPLALPMLWQSPHFARRWKIILSVLVVVIGVVALGALAHVAVWCIDQIRSAR